MGLINLTFAKKARFVRLLFCTVNPLMKGSSSQLVFDELIIKLETNGAALLTVNDELSMVQLTSK